MRMTGFQVTNFRSILDSGWVNVDDISVIVGKNESGKTSLLKALAKFHPHDESGYNIDKEWPRGFRKDKGVGQVVTKVRFALSAEDIKLIEAIGESVRGVTAVLVSRTYKGNYTYAFEPLESAPSNSYEPGLISDLISSGLLQPTAPVSEAFLTKYMPAVSSLAELARKAAQPQLLQARLDQLRKELSSFVANPAPESANEPAHIAALVEILDQAKELIKTSAARKVIDILHPRLPTFIYMDDHKAFAGSAILDEVQKRKSAGLLTPEDETFILIMGLAGLDLDREVENGNKPDKEQRVLDMNDASQTLTGLIANRWSQKKYEVMFQADGQHLITFVKDVGSVGLVPLEDRSKGFQWFFSFDLTFMHETKGRFTNAILLLDEPGLHLHPGAQNDLLKRMKEYAKTNQLIYTTHLPFMIDFTRFDNIHVAEDLGAVQGTRIHQDWAAADKDARFTLQAALGLSWSQSLFVGQYNLVVEGVTDFWFLSCLSELLRLAGRSGLDEDLVVTPAGGASKVAYIGTILRGQNLNVCVLLDSDAEGESAQKQLVHQWLLEDRQVLMLGTVLGDAQLATLEDLFDRNYYVALAEQAYREELKGQSLAPAVDSRGLVVEAVEAALKSFGIPKFNKGRVAKLIMHDLGHGSIDKLGTDTADRAGKVISAINDIVASWKK